MSSVSHRPKHCHSAPGREARRSGEMAKQGLGQGPAGPAGPAWWVQGHGLSPHNPWNEASQMVSRSPSALIIRNKAEPSADLCFEVARDGWDHTDPDNPDNEKVTPFSILSGDGGESPSWVLPGFNTAQTLPFFRASTLGRQLCAAVSWYLI